MQKSWLSVITFGLFLCIPMVSYSSVGIQRSGNISSAMTSSNENLLPGDVLNISCLNPYPIVGEPVDLLILLKGNPGGEEFQESLQITDDYEGLIAASSGIIWEAGTTSFDQVTVTIRTDQTYTIPIGWYPIIVGNHTLRVQAGVFTEQRKNISVGFDSSTLIYPSLGCPRIISKDESTELVVVVSEERAPTEEPLAVDFVLLQQINGSATYTLENQTRIFTTWIQSSEETREDELIAGYNVSMIPSGFYNITLITKKQSYHWPHAVKIIDEEPTEYTVVQLTDIHIGKSYNLVNEKRELKKKISYINEHLHPDFVVLSGDLVDWYNEQMHPMVFSDFATILLTCNVPTFTTSGNHERYANGLLRLYYPFTKNTAYHRFLNPLNDYAFEYGSVNWVFLDSGYDYSRWETAPESTGLTLSQIELLTQQWGDDRLNQIITMHHPAVNDKKDRGLGAVPDNLSSGNDQCIAFHRADFIQYCQDHNVSLVLSGHTHENKVLTSSGHPPLTSSQWPLFIQTDSATLNGRRSGGRVVTIKNGITESYDYIPFN